MSKYDISGSQGRYQLGSNDKVLENSLGITETADMDEAELVLLSKIYEDVLLSHCPLSQLTLDDIKTWHRRWLGNVYAWAGEERSVNMAKDDFQFAAAAQIPRLLTEFEHKYLKQYTPCTGFSDEQLIEAIAIVHVELILIHPFRDGNGRLSRLLSDVMAVQAGRQPLDYSRWDLNKAVYFAAIAQGMSLNYEPMMACIQKALSDVIE